MGHATVLEQPASHGERLAICTQADVVVEICCSE